MSRSRLPLVGLSAALALVAASIAIPEVTGWQVRSLGFPPLNATWLPRVGPGSITAVLIGLLACLFGVSLAERAPWGWLLLGCMVVGVAWLSSLALVDGTGGLGSVLNHTDEYLPTARSIGSLADALRTWVDRIPADAGPERRPTHVAGHPPGATFFFVVLARVGLRSGLAAGVVVTVIAATTPIAVMLTLRRLGAESTARRVAPFLVVGPAAIWSAVSADAVFAAVTAWAMCTISVAATTAGSLPRVAWATLSGVLLGLLAMLSYGLPIVALLAVAVSWLARSHRASLLLAVSAVAATAVVAAGALYGFNYLQAFFALKQRYWSGIASARPGAYWTWADLAALTFAAGPLAGAGLALALGSSRRLLRDPVTRVAALSLVALSTVVVADASQMSRAEVERIWLPFVPWLLLSVTLLPASWRRWGLTGQVVTALLVQHLLHTTW